MNRYSAIALVLVASVNVAAQVPTPPTIPELVARQTKGPLYLMRILELVPEPLEILMKKADLIVHGVVSHAVTYLSDDQRDLYTDLTITPLRIVMQRQVMTSSTPGLSPPIIVKRWGGQAVINGMQVIQEHGNLRSFAVGEEVFLILMYDSSSQKYYLQSDIAGAFAVSGGRVQVLLRHPFYEQFDGISVDQFVPEIQKTTGVVR